MSRSVLKRSEDRSLLVIVLDVSPVVWNVRDMKRAASDRVRFSKNKQSVGPATLEECLKSIQSFCGGYCSMQRDCALLVIGVAGNEAAVLFPRKDALHHFFQGEASKLDIQTMQGDMIEGVAELIARRGAEADEAAMAAGMSVALCNINRFLVANNSGVSALQAGSELFRKDDDGIVSIMGGPSKRKSSSLAKAGAWSSRILVVQASNDRSKDYNAFMNCTFAAIKFNIVVDGCFIPSGLPKDLKNSAFLEQACDRTDGVYLAPTGMAQVGAAFTEILFTIFLAPIGARASLNLPAVNKVDFRARCFETGETVSMAFVCNQCLSIFKTKPKDTCPTCGADILSRKIQKATRSSDV